MQKWHGAGNDFLVDICEDPEWWNERRARSVCARTTGVGADGIIAVRLGGAAPRMWLRNADGSPAEVSGNGLRCLAGALVRAGRAMSGPMDIETPAGIRRVSVELNGADGHGSVDMGPVTVDRGPEGTLGVVRVGNPHVVVRDDPSWDEGRREDVAAPLSTALGGANVEFVTVKDRGRVSISVIERGAGWTQACGTGSVATAALLNELGEVDDIVAVENPGGVLTVSLMSGGATLSGPVRFVAETAWAVP
jgi:diaminopimelate epimerase